MKKAVAFTAAGCIIGLCAITGFAIDIDSAKEQLHQQLSSSSYDFMGFKYEELYFKLRESYSNGSISKSLLFDLQTLMEQISLGIKCFEDNDIIYYCTGAAGVLLKLKKASALLRLLRIR